MPAASIAIQPLGFELPVAKAARELQAYLPLLAPVTVHVLDPLPSLSGEPLADVILGTSDHLVGCGLRSLPTPDPVDDAFAIVPRKGRLYLAGSNPRSVLFAVYRLLEELGALFLRPGPGGEVLPRADQLKLPTRAIRERASYRHRGICIEGHPRLEHTLPVLDWMAKKKMNCFQIQFFHGRALWWRGYSAPDVSEPAQQLGTAVVTEADSESLDEQVVARMRELGMMLHKVGHGWTARTLGYPGKDWYEEPTHPLPRSKKPWVAQVNGERRLWRNLPTQTELCYSRPEVRAAFADEVVAYARQHPEVDYLHVWLSDSTNNQCECADCAKRPSPDWYVLLINEIARRVRQDGLHTRIVFLAYQDLMWPPERVRPAADLTFMFAPSGRCYFHSLGDRECGSASASKRPARNRLTEERLSGNRSVVDIAAGWRHLGLTDSFAFDYHQWRAVWDDARGYDLGTTMAHDVSDLADLGLNGLMSCQCLRSFYPTPYLANAMADTLWNRSLPIRRHRQVIMEAAFGEHADDAERYMSQVRRAWRRGTNRQHKTILRTGSPAEVVPPAAGEVEQLAAFAENAMRTFAKRAAEEEDAVARVSLDLLALHAEYTALILRIHLAGAGKDRKALASLRRDFETRLPSVLQRFGLWVDPIIAHPVSVAMERAAQAAR